jgi:DNA-binding PucR family transcriptional regulator
MGLPYSEEAESALLEVARRALRFAKRVLADTLRRPGEVIASFDRAPVGVGPASSPEVLAELAQAALGTLNQLPDDERHLLITTMRAWVACGGSADATARALGCRPSTVRYRINRALQGI